VTRADGCKYEGEFVARMQHGHGVMTFPNGIKIEGNFVEGSPDDNSTVYYPDNTKYVGERKGILPHG